MTAARAALLGGAFGGGSGGVVGGGIAEFFAGPGTHGMLCVDEYRPRLEVYGERGQTLRDRVVLDPGAGRTLGILDDFIAAIDADHAPLVGPRDGKAVTAAILAAYESAATNQVVRVKR